MIWYWIDLGYACGGVATAPDGCIIAGMPIVLRHWQGRSLSAALTYWRARGQMRGLKTLGT